jgi:acyl-coenzyme A thioesterase 13
MAGRLSLQAARAIFEAKSRGVRTFDRVLAKMTLVSAGDGKCVCELPVGEEHVNEGRLLHGGMTATMVDTVSTLAIMTMGDGHPGVSLDLNVTYLKAAKIGECLTISSECLRVGKSVASAFVDIKNQKGQLICQGRQTKYLLPLKQTS